MPLISTIGHSLAVRDVVGNTGWAPTDYVLSVGPGTVFPNALAGGIVLSLPGPELILIPDLIGAPNPNPLNQLPQNGDFYKFSDPRGVVDGSTNTVTIWGGGYDMWNGLGNAPDLVDQLDVPQPFQSWEFTFDQANQVWIVCAGGPFDTTT